MRATVKQYKDALEEMKHIYFYEDDKTYMETKGLELPGKCVLSLITKDEETDIMIHLEKDLREEKA